MATEEVERNGGGSGKYAPRGGDIRNGAVAPGCPGRVVGSVAMTAADPQRAVEAVWRIESARLIARLTRMVGDVGTAEELAQDALVIALEQWPADGVPDNPGAWLMATAKHRAIDHLRRSKRLDRKHEELGRAQARRQDTTEARDAT